MALKPKFTKKWWDENKPVTLLAKTGVGKAMVQYGMAREKFDDVKILEALDEIETGLKKATKESNKTLHADFRKALLLMTTTVEDERTEIKARKIAAQKADMIETVDDKKETKVKTEVVKQSIGKSVVVWEQDVAKLVTDRLKDVDWITNFKGWKLNLTLNDDILKLLEEKEDYTTPAFMVQDAQEIGDATADAIVKWIDSIQKASVGQSMDKINKLRDSLKGVATKEMEKAAAKLEKVPAERWAKFASKYAQYRSYQIKTGANIAIGVLGTAGLIAGIAASHGAGLVIGIVGLARTVSTLLNTCYRAMQDADKVGKDLAKALEILTRQYTSAAKQAAKEIAGTTLKSILSVDAPFIETLPKCQTMFKDWDNKVAGVTIAGREASKAITSLLKACEKAEEEFKNAPKAEAKTVYGKLSKARVALDKALNEISDLMAKVTKFEKNSPGLKQVLDSLQSDNPSFANIFEKVMPVLVSIGIAAAGAGVSFSEAANVISYYNTAQGLFNDLANEGRQKLEEMLS